MEENIKKNYSIGKKNYRVTFEHLFLLLIIIMKMYLQTIVYDLFIYQFFYIKSMGKHVIIICKVE